jgi:hypothetical protein
MALMGWRACSSAVAPIIRLWHPVYQTGDKPTPVELLMEALGWTPVEYAFAIEARTWA